MTPDIRLKQRKDCGDWHSLRVYIRAGAFVVRRNVLTREKEHADFFAPHREICGAYYCQTQTVITYEEIRVILRYILTHPGWLWRKWRAVKRANKNNNQND